MQRYFKIILMVSSLFIGMACSEKQDFQGEWVATDPNSQNYIITMSHDLFSYEREDGGLLTLPLQSLDETYRANILYYNILLDNNPFLIYFPDRNNLNQAWILEPKIGGLPYEGIMHFKMQRKKE